MRELLRLLRRARIGLVALALFGSAGASAAQPADWCLRWTDSCSTCSRVNGKAEAVCSTPRSGCVAGPTRCVRADSAALRQACEKTRVVRDNSCNSCGVDANGRRSCTLILCAPRDIICVIPR